MAEHFAIIGNGTAGFRAAKALRASSGAARVSLFTHEPHPFYLRRQLGDLLCGELRSRELLFQSRNAYRRERIDLLLSTRITRIDPDAHEVVFGSGERARYDRLLVATGTEAASPGVPGEDLRGVVRLDSLGRAAETRAAILAGRVKQAVLLDEGLVSLAMAEGLVAAGIRVTQLVRGERLWPDMLDDQTATMVEGLMEENGVVLRRGVAARSVVGAGGQSIGVETSRGDILPAELVGYGSCRRPAVGLLAGLGAAMGRGVRVDGRFQTSLRDIFAAGDVAEPSRPLGAGLAAPASAAPSPDPPAGGCPFCWQRAWTQGDLAAAGMLDRAPDAAPDTLRLRTTVFGRDLAVLGEGHLPQGAEVDALVLRNRADAYRRLVFRAGRLVGAVVVGAGETVQQLNRLVAAGVARETFEASLRPPPSDRTTDRLPTTFAQHCPICAAELVAYRGTPVGQTLRCRACNTDLVVRWDGRRGRLDVARP